MKHIVYTLVLLLINCTNLIAQDKQAKSLINEIASHREGSNWYKFDQKLKPTRENINSMEIKKYFEMDTDNSFELIKSNTDELKMTHHTFQQTYKGYPIQFAQFKLHVLADQSVEGNGHYIPNFFKPMPVKISFAQALQAAMTYFPAQKYLWQDSVEESSLKLRRHNALTTYFPKEELIWAISNRSLNDMTIANYTLAYKMIIAASEPSFTKEIYIDAVTGKLLNDFELEHQCGTHTFTSNFNGSRTVAFANIGSIHKLVDSCGIGDQIWTSDNSSASTPYSKASAASWPNNNNFNSAATSMWALREAEKYYYNVHARDGWDTTNFEVDLRQNANFGTVAAPEYRNASFSGYTGICKVGNNQSAGPNAFNSTVADDINSVDVLAHEMTHGVTYMSAGLVYSGESGALNESFSDIFAINTYQYVGGYSAANLWKIGYDIIIDSAHFSLRDLANPHSKSDPDTYLSDAFWRDTTATASDNGGVHHNSGVQNYMYYLLTNGGSGTNANGLSYSITGIGFAAARAIAYRALVAGYLNANSNHIEARDAWVHAAVDLYSNCSAQSQAVGMAWEAVGVGPYWYYGNNICGSYAGTQFYQSNSPYFISATGCTTTILGTGNQVKFNGGDFVNISPGFNTNTGAFFTATTNNCFYSNY